MAKIVIVGGGVAGLSAGIYAQLNGHHAVVCEQHTVAGGNLTGWQRGEYHIDNCIHWLTGTNPATDTYRMWEELGALSKDVPIHQGESLYTCERDGKTLTLWRDLDRFERDMLELSPEDAPTIRSFIKTVRDVQGYVGIGGETHDQKNNPLQTLAMLPRLLKHYRMSTKALAERFHHPLLRDFMTQFIGTEFSSFALVVITATFCGDNGGIPQGGSCAMAKRMTKRLEQLGGELLLGKEVLLVQHENGEAKAVCFADGSSIEADYVIIAADPSMAYRKLLELPMPRALEKEYSRADMHRFSSYHCALSCDAAELPFHGDFVFKIPQEYRERMGTSHLVVREFSHEAEYAPSGKNVLQTMTLCDEKTAKQFIGLRKDREAYREKKRQIARDVQEIITKKFPALLGKLKALDVWTPATYRRYTGAEIGSWMSFILPATHLPKKMDNRAHGLRNVIFATQWMRAPGGLPLAAAEGKRAIETVQKLG
ncbi:MAG: NAD(P)/FAD-dependent oxidoreductase [Clostridia bacterium]|nr:NAD(P)/FAD-dependent oxidoreductase [Clostridia bacterium]MBQ9774303.1 NAD(P)/FAD-dependent oxidoreductase [Clostridia bacterium]